MASVPADPSPNTALGPRTPDSPAPPRRLRIAYVVHDYNRRFGHSRYVAELASRFKRDHDVHIFANTFEESDPHSLVYHHVPAWRLNIMATLLTFILPSTWMVRGAFDVIHAQGFCGLRQNVVTAHMCQVAWLDAMTRSSGRPAWRKRVYHSLAGWFERRTFAAGGRGGLSPSPGGLRKTFNTITAVRKGCG